MGYTYRNSGQITDFWPDNTEDEFYLSNQPLSLSLILEEAKAYWDDDIDLDNIEISSENIHTNCLTYDLHDSSDYTQFLVIRRIK